MNATVDHERELADAVALRRTLHRLPETGFEVGETASRVADRLHAGGLDVATGFAGGVVATLSCGTGGRAIGLRAELDGLPIEEANDFDHRSLNAGKFHGCGHDGHMTMLISAALRLARRRNFEGTVHFIFQPDEENGGGAQAMIEAGLFDASQWTASTACTTCRVCRSATSPTRSGIFTAFEDTFEIRLQGRGGDSSRPTFLLIRCCRQPNW